MVKESTSLIDHNRQTGRMNYNISIYLGGALGNFNTKNTPTFIYRAAHHIEGKRQGHIWFYQLIHPDSPLVPSRSHTSDFPSLSDDKKVDRVSTSLRCHVLTHINRNIDTRVEEQEGSYTNFVNRLLQPRKNQGYN